MAKVLISLDEQLLRRIDRRAKSQGLSRSAYFARLSQRDIATAGQGVTSAVRRALRDLDALFASAPRGDRTQLIREERDAH